MFDGWRPRLRASYILKDKSSGDLEDHCLKRSFMDDCFAILPRASEGLSLMTASPSRLVSVKVQEAHSARRAAF
jgi:hypothetical protein